MKVNKCNVNVYLAYQLFNLPIEALLARPDKTKKDKIIDKTERPEYTWTYQ
jgi:hypothetical protein